MCCGPYIRARLGAWWYWRLAMRPWPSITIGGAYRSCGSCGAANKPQPRRLVPGSIRLRLRDVPSRAASHRQWPRVRRNRACRIADQPRRSGIPACPAPRLASSRSATHQGAGAPGRGCVRQPAAGPPAPPGPFAAAAPAGASPARSAWAGPPEPDGVGAGLAWCAVPAGHVGSGLAGMTGSADAPCRPRHFSKSPCGDRFPRSKDPRPRMRAAFQSLLASNP